jgi:hypothetical protein
MNKKKTERVTMISMFMIAFLTLSINSTKGNQNFETSLDDFINGSLESLDNIDLSSANVMTDDGVSASNDNNQEQVQPEVNQKVKEKSFNDYSSQTKVQSRNSSNTKVEEKESKPDQSSEKNSQQNQVLDVMSGAHDSSSGNLAKMNKVDFYLKVRGNHHSQIFLI